MNVDERLCIEQTDGKPGGMCAGLAYPSRGL